MVKFYKVDKHFWRTFQFEFDDRSLCQQNINDLGLKVDIDNCALGRQKITLVLR